MIRYSNKSGFGVICSRWGSVFNDTAKPALFAAVMTSLVYLSTKGYFGPAAQLDLTSFEHPIAFQSYAFSLAYLVSMRAKLALDRYTAGIENVQFMTSKWADAFMQLRAFVAAEQANCPEEKVHRINAFIQQQLHWFSMLSGCAMKALAEEKLDLELFEVVKVPPLGVQYMDDILMSEQTAAKPVPRDARGVTLHSRYDMLHRSTRNPITSFKMPHMRLTVLGVMPPEEIEKLKKMPDMINAIMMWIIESITLAHVRGDVSVAL
jgi:hypothetical protein